MIMTSQIPRHKVCGSGKLVATLSAPKYTIKVRSGMSVVVIYSPFYVQVTVLTCVCVVRFRESGIG